MILSSFNLCHTNLRCKKLFGDLGVLSRVNQGGVCPPKKKFLRRHSGDSDAGGL